MASCAYDDGTHSSGTVQDFHLFPFSLQQCANHFYKRKGKNILGFSVIYPQKKWGVPNATSITVHPIWESNNYYLRYLFKALHHDEHEECRDEAEYYEDAPYCYQ